ncbi:hypothetical protein ACGFXC_05355 [Streptomyces sp. NPDC048507]|uniref:hypothetical protein n=1 Tax=Streptomyces sp. NPDC048507 TaxID=3365560 RepID=UPI00371DCC8E
MDHFTQHPAPFGITVDAERFTCEEVQGLGPQGDGGLPGQELTLTFTGCVLTDTPRAAAWALGEDPVRPRSVTLDEPDATGRAVVTTWELTDAVPAGLQGASTTASNHETRIQRLTVHAAKITPVLRDEERTAADPAPPRP